MVSSIKRKIIKNIKYYRELNKLTPKDLSLKIDKKEDFIEKLESYFYKVEPTVDTVTKIAKVLGITTNELILRKKDE